MSEARAIRVGDQIQREVASILASGKLKDDRIGFVTVTAVRLTPDLMDATIYYVAHGTPEQQKTSAEALGEHVGKLRSHIGKQMKIRHAPTLKFVVDDSIEKGDRIETLLREVRKKEGW